MKDVWSENSSRAILKICRKQELIDGSLTAVFGWDVSSKRTLTDILGDVWSESAPSAILEGCLEQELIEGSMTAIPVEKENKTG